MQRLNTLKMKRFLVEYIPVSGCDVLFAEVVHAENIAIAADIQSVTATVNVFKLVIIDMGQVLDDSWVHDYT